MPPKPKFTKEEIVAAALRVVSQKGADGLTAKELGDALGSSARPIFTIFNTMKEVQEEVRLAAMAKFDSFSPSGLSEMPIFKQIGMKMVLFGMQEPKLYQLLFMEENQNAASFDDLFGELGETAVLSIHAIEESYGLTAKEARFLFENVWIYTYGIGTLCATNFCHFTEEQFSNMLSTQFHAMINFVKSGEAII